MKPRVFVVNEPLKTNRETGEKGRAIDLRPAQEHGELVFLSPAGEPPLDPSAWLPRMEELLSTFAPDDCLLPVGHPALIVAAAGLIAKWGNRLEMNNEGDVVPVMNEISVLVWCGKPTGYAKVRLPLFARPKNQFKPTNPQSQEN